MNVPELNTYYPSRSGLTDEQSEFYEFWLNNWNDDISIDVGQNQSYLFIYMYEMLAQADYGHAVAEFNRLRTSYTNCGSVPFYCGLWTSDINIKLGHYAEAVLSYPDIPIDRSSHALTCDLLNRKLLADDKISARDVFTLYGAKVTKFARAHLSELSPYIEQQIEAHEIILGTGIIQHWANLSTKLNSFGVFRGSVSSHQLALPSYQFAWELFMKDFLTVLTRESENVFRENLGIAPVGEGWVSETLLFYKLKERFAGETIVIHHGRPKWLGRQHIDIFFPDWEVAVEFQGRQHDEPVAFFGGEPAFLENQRRDQKKLELCMKNNVHLIYVRDGYDFELLVQQIVAASVRLERQKTSF